jgi:hypothetical protein
VGAAAAAVPAGASEAEPAAAAFFAASIFAYIDCAPRKPPAAGASASSFACEPRRLGIVVDNYRGRLGIVLRTQGGVTGAGQSTHTIPAPAPPKQPARRKGGLSTMQLRCPRRTVYTAHTAHKAIQPYTRHTSYSAIQRYSLPLLATVRAGQRRGSWQAAWRG